eukprot:700947-Prymnesium_polylepis.2
MPMKDGAFCREEDGGSYGEWSNRKEPKYKQEVRFLFGVAVNRDEASGEFSGHRIEPFEYTGRWVVGVKSYNEAVQNEVARANRLKGCNQWSTTRMLTQEQLAALKGG